MEKAVVSALCHHPQVHPFWDRVDELTARVGSERLESIDLAFACDNVSPPCSEVRRMVSLTLLAVAMTVV